VSVHPSGLYVRYVGVDHTPIVKGIFTICNSAGSFTGTLKNGKRYNCTTPSLGGCNFFGQIVGPVNIYRNYSGCWWVCGEFRAAGGVVGVLVPWEYRQDWLLGTRTIL